MLKGDARVECCGLSNRQRKAAAVDSPVALPLVVVVVVVVVVRPVLILAARVAPRGGSSGRVDAREVVGPVALVPLAESIVVAAAQDLTTMGAAYVIRERKDYAN